MKDVIPALWAQPMESVLGILVFAVAVGAVVLNVGLVASVANAWLAHDWAELGFGPKGIAGIVLYWAVIGFGVSALVPAGTLPVAPGAILLLAGGAALPIMLGDLICNLVTGHRPLAEGGLGTHLIKKALEFFWTRLSLFSSRRAPHQRRVRDKYRWSCARPSDSRPV